MIRRSTGALALREQLELPMNQPLTIYRQQIREAIIDHGNVFERTMTYFELAVAIGRPQMPLHYFAFPLGDVSLDCHRRGEPLLSAIVVSEHTGEPGDGFWKMINTIYRARFVPRDRELFLQNMQESVLRFCR